MKDHPLIPQTVPFFRQKLVDVFKYPLVRNQIPRLQCSASGGPNGDSILLQHYAPDWKHHNFDNRANYCCAVGV